MKSPTTRFVLSVAIPNGVANGEQGWREVEVGRMYETSEGIFGAGDVFAKNKFTLDIYVGEEAAIAHEKKQQLIKVFVHSLCFIDGSVS